MPQAIVNGTSLHYHIQGRGDGEVVMLSNSLASDQRIWKFQVPVLTEAGFKVLCYDSRGHGQSSAPSGPYSLEMLSMDALELLNFLGLEQVHFCGISLGGMVGQMLGAYHGERLASLILCDTSACTAFRKIWDGRIKAVRKYGMAAIVDSTIDRWFTKPGQKRLKKEVSEIRNMILNTPVEGYCGCCSAIRNLDLRTAIGNISTRTLIICGLLDMGTPVSMAESIKKRVATSELKIIPEAAHFVNMEQADIFNTTILEFLSKR